MKILIFSLGRKGGSVRYATEIVNRLKCEYKIFTSLFSIEKNPRNSIKIPTYNGSMSFIFSTLFFLPFFLIFLLFYQRKHKFNVIYFPYFHYWNYPIIKIIKIIFPKTKIVSTVHDGIPHLGDGKLLEKELNYKCIINSDKLIFLTEYVKNRIEEWVNTKLNSVVIPHGLIFLDGVNNKPRKWKRNMTLLFFGRVSKYKGIELLLESIKDIDCDKFNKLIIAGKWQYDLDISLFDKCEKIEIINKFLNEKEISELLNKSDILILPYIEATQSGVITLGISASIPMVVTKVGGLCEQLNDSQALFIEPNKKELKKAINRLITDKDLYESISFSLYKKQTELTWDKIAQDIYKELKNV